MLNAKLTSSAVICPESDYYPQVFGIAVNPATHRHPCGSRDPEVPKPLRSNQKFAIPNQKNNKESFICLRQQFYALLDSCFRRNDA